MAACLLGPFEDQIHDFYLSGNCQERSLPFCENQTLSCYEAQDRAGIFFPLNNQLFIDWQFENSVLKHVFLKICEKHSLPLLRNISSFFCLHEH